MLLVCKHIVSTLSALWNILLGDRCPFLPLWCDFLTESEKVEAISKDTWYMLYDFIDQTKGDINNYVDDGKSEIE
jgi:hypothetical protein